MATFLSRSFLYIGSNKYHFIYIEWLFLVGATKLVSHEATKLCMAFQGQGMTSIEECQCLVDKVEKTCLTLLAVFLTLPKAKGM